MINYHNESMRPSAAAEGVAALYETWAVGLQMNSVAEARDTLGTGVL